MEKLIHVAMTVIVLGSIHIAVDSLNTLNTAMNSINAKQAVSIQLARK